MEIKLFRSMTKTFIIDEENKSFVEFELYETEENGNSLRVHTNLDGICVHTEFMHNLETDIEVLYKGLGKSNVKNAVDLAKLHRRELKEYGI